MTEKEIKEYVTEIRHKADIFRKSGFATAGFATHFDKSADIIEELLPYMAIGTIEEFKALKEKNETLKALYEDARKEGSHLIARERAKAIDEFAEKLIKHISQMPSGYIGSGNVLIIAEQMKAGGIDE